MKREIRLIAGAALLCTVAASGAPAQSLVDIARQEQARRAAIAPRDRSRVYTNDDLRDRGGLTIGVLPSGPVTEADAGTGRAASGIGTGQDDGAAPAADDIPGENEWRARMTTAQQARARAELTASALQNRADGLWAQFTAMDDPARRRVVERQRTEALAELDRTQAETERLQQQIRGIQEEARRAGVPPGWLR